jgi:hypothetical protein
MHYRARYASTPVAAWCFAPPGGLMSPGAAASLEGACTSVVSAKVRLGRPGRPRSKPVKHGAPSQRGARWEGRRGKQVAAMLRTPLPTSSPPPNPIAIPLLHPRT